MITFTMFDWQLQNTSAGLTLKKNAVNKTLCIDFTDKKISYRRQHSSFHQEAIIRAAGLKANTQPILLDVTAGLGRDAFILASFGFHIHLLERSPMIHALLDDALKRGLQNETISDIVQRMHLIHTDSIHFLEHRTIVPDIIFMDPMFPSRKKSALPSLEMQIFHEVIGNDTDASFLFEKALACASERVVIKRPRLSPFMCDRKPHFSLTGKSSRFDVYLIRKSE